MIPVDYWMNTQTSNLGNMEIKKINHKCKKNQNKEATHEGS